MDQIAGLGLGRHEEAEAGKEAGGQGGGHGAAIEEGEKSSGGGGVVGRAGEEEQGHRSTSLEQGHKHEQGSHEAVDALLHSDRKSVV